MIRVVVVEDHTFVRQSLVLLLSSQDDIVVLADTASGGRGLALTKSHRPDVVVLDIGLPDRDGLDVGAAIRRDVVGSALVYLSMYDDDATIRAAVRLRCDAFVLKTDAIEEVCNAVRSAAHGLKYYSVGVAAAVNALTAAQRQGVDVGYVPEVEDLHLLQSALADVLLDPVGASRTGLDVSPARLAELVNAAGTLDDVSRRRRRPFEDLTRGEAEVLAAIVDGLSAQAIARHRQVSVSTVRTQIRSVLLRLGVSSQLEAVALARRADWPSGRFVTGNRGTRHSSRDDRP